MTTSAMNAIVTGGSGFMGRPLVSRLLSAGGRVAVITRKDSVSRSRLIDHPNLTIVDGDLDDVEAWHGPLSHFNADTFYNLAWKDVGNSNRNDIIQITNIEPAAATLRLAKELGCRRWIGTGSQAEYGTLNRRISEDDVTRPTTLYGAAKLSACLVTQILGRELGIEAAWVRIFSIYGPGDTSGRMLDYLATKLLNGQMPRLTAGEQLWDYLYVDDAAEALLALGAADAVSGIYNLGSGQVRVLRSVVEMVRDLINPDFPLVFGEIPYKAHEVMHLEANIDKIKRDTGWRPQVPLEEGLPSLVASLRRRASARL